MKRASIHNISQHWDWRLTSRRTSFKNRPNRSGAWYVVMDLNAFQNFILTVCFWWFNAINSINPIKTAVAAEFIYIYLIKFNKISLPNWNNCCLITKYISLEIETWKRNKRSDTSHKYSPALAPSCQYQLWLVGAGAIMAARNLFRSVIVFPGTRNIALWAALVIDSALEGIYAKDFPVSQNYL